MGHKVSTALIAAVLLTAVAAAGCARPEPGGPVRHAGTSGADRDTGTGTATGGPGDARDPESIAGQAAVYIEVLHRYLGTPGENSFPAGTFTVAYVLDAADPDAADPMNTRPGRVPLAPQVQRMVRAAAPEGIEVRFVRDRTTVLEAGDGCPRVRQGGILVALGTIQRAAGGVTVPVHGFVACTGATWLTYVLRWQPDQGWRVTGTTGSAAVA